MHKPVMLYTAVLSCSVLAGPCFAGDLKAFTGKDMNMATYKTYTWTPTKALTKSGIVENEPEFTKIVKEAVNKELTARGLKEVESGGDLDVVVLAATASVPRIDMFIFSWVYADYPTPLNTVGAYNREGTLAINLIDSRAKKFAWAGFVSKTIDRNPGSGMKKIPKAVEDLFKKYPIAKQ